MFKIIGLLAIISASSLFGISCSDKLKRRVSELNLINYMLDEISVLIRYKAMTVYEIINALKQNKMYEKLSFINNLECNISTPFNSAWDKSIDNMQSELETADKKLLKSFGNSLGTTDILGQLSSIEVFKADFKRLEKEASESYGKKSRLYRSLGLLGGIFISIMLM